MGIQLADSSIEDFVPFGCFMRGSEAYFCTARACETLVLNLYENGKPAFSASFPKEQRQGDVWHMALCGLQPERVYTYAFQADGIEIPDPYGTAFSGRERFGKRKARENGAPRAILLKKEKKACMQHLHAQKPIPYEDSIFYRLHVRGFTKDRSSGVPEAERGTFLGIVQKLPYLQDLGITSIELMPPYEFEELLRTSAFSGFGSRNARMLKTQSTAVKLRQREKQEAGKVNYWGFTEDALRFAPKAAFGGTAAFLRLADAIHAAGMELIIDLYFTGREETQYVLDTIRHWHYMLHIDGVHIVGFAPLESILRDPYLKGVKVIADEIPAGLVNEQAKDQTGNQNEMSLYADNGFSRRPAAFSPAAGNRTAKNGEGALFFRRAASCNDGFLNDMRRYLKGDSGMIGRVIDRMQMNPHGKAELNYMANVSGFTMMDMLSYDRKHNEENGEYNRDGTDQNESWNCGIEGPTRRKKILELRRQLYKNAILLTFLSQGTPLLLAGDEMGHTRKGNNNPWCQDNAIEWLDWTDLNRNEELYAFTRAVIWLRKKHSVFRRREACRGTDYRNAGMPDVSFHGESAWKVDYENDRRQIAVLYSGAYGRGMDSEEADDSFYICSNMHWEPHLFAVPALAKGMCWYRLFDTAAPFCSAMAEEQEVLARKLPDGTRSICAKGRSMIVLIGKKTAKQPESQIENQTDNKTDN